ncbi:hypothetical protein [Streptomyces halstedii]|uniref:hypothetical protein n=1 Tax=Streptomyces halstedii TaxID=1944 RepID=UPI0036544D08
MLSDDDLCTTEFPGDEHHAGQLCDQPAGHQGEHKALAEVGPGWRRHIAWPNTACRWPACLTEGQQRALADEVLRQMEGKPPSPPPPDQFASCGCPTPRATATEGAR